MDRAPSRINRRPIIAAVLLGAVAAAAFLLPAVRHEYPDVLSALRIPSEFGYWKSRDVSSLLDIRDKRYAFKSKVHARQYTNDLGETLLFMIVDTASFHHPKVCFSSSGFEVRPQENIQAAAAKRSLPAQALFMEKGAESQLVVYWMCLDGKIVDWNEQKLREFFHSLSGKPRAGLMGRLDVPVRNSDTAGAEETAKSFLKALGNALSAEDADLLFGKKI